MSSPASSLTCLQQFVERRGFDPKGKGGSNDKLSKRGFILGQHIRKLLQFARPGSLAQRQAVFGSSAGDSDWSSLAVRSLTRSENVLVETRVLSPYDSEVHVRALPPLQLGITPEAGGGGSCSSGPCLLYLLSSSSSFGIKFSSLLSSHGCTALTFLAHLLSMCVLFMTRRRSIRSLHELPLAANAPPVAAAAVCTRWTHIH